MTLLIYTWAASILGAALFFLAGAFFAARRHPSRAVQPAAPRPDPRAQEREIELAQARADADRASIFATRAGEQARLATSDAERLAEQLRTAEVERDRLGLDVRTARAEAERHAADRRAALAERARMTHDLKNARAEVERHIQELRAARAEIEPLARKAKEEEERAEVRERALVAVQTDRQQLTAEREQTRTRVSAVQAALAVAEERLADAERRLAVPADTATEALRHELVLTEERIRARDAQLDRLRDETAGLRLVERELEQVRGEAVALADEVRSLRSAAFAGRPPKRLPRATPVPAPGSRGDALQSIVDREADDANVQAAVIADELGLVVVSTGEYGDALAAFGAYLKDVGSKTREVLPLNEVRQVTVRDDHGVTLSVRPLELVDANLALVTLAVGQQEETKR